MPKKLVTALAVLAAMVAFGRQAPRANVTAIYFKSPSASHDELVRIPDREFSAIKTVEALPISVRAALASAFKQEHLLIANPGERFNPSDVVNSYPRRRLIFAGCTKDKCVVHYEKGGLTHQYIAIIFKVDDKQNAGLLWDANYLEPAHDLEQLRAHPHSAKDQPPSF